MYKNLICSKLIKTRIDTNSKKWSRYKDDIIPFWIADMDIESPDFLIEDLIKRANKNYFGYTDIDEKLNLHIVNWNKKVKNLEISQDNIIFSTSVLNSYEAILDAYLKFGDSIILFTPVYTQLLKIAKRNYNVVEYKLTEYSFNFDIKELENTINKTANTKCIVLCNPHNPGGKLWKYKEILEIAKLCKKYDLILISDEIHSDLVYKDEEFIPALRVLKEIDINIFSLNSIGKTFNVSGLKASYIITNDRNVEYIRTIIKDRRYHDIDIFSITAMYSLYENFDKSLDWLKSTMDIIKKNYNFVKENLDNDKFTVSNNQSTYLIWIKVNNPTCNDSLEMRNILIEKYKIDLHEGSIFGALGRNYLRMNIACPIELLAIGVKSLNKASENKDI